MNPCLLEKMANDIRYDSLPPSWNSFSLTTFSKKKTLWDYQKKAVENAVKILKTYYEDIEDWNPTKVLEANHTRKAEFFKWYQNNGLEEDLDIGLNRANRNIVNLLEEYYEINNNKIPYHHFINRMGFWMATGSGKTLVLVKLIQILSLLIRRREIPAYDILILTHRDDLIGQLKRHVDEFNSAHGDFFIKLRELKEYPDVKRENPTLFRDKELTVFYYRSDNISDEQKEKIIDFSNYDNSGRWYIFLDEAHKGDKEDSKRQHIYSIMSRNGFLFNFSATFTDSRDVLTTVSNFNLSEFIKAGYGKHLSILEQEFRAFRNDEDYNGEEKQKVVLKSLIMLAYVQKANGTIRKQRADLYHRPLLLTLVNSVNTEDADLKLFFRELERIGKGRIPKGIFESAVKELWEELKYGSELMFEGDRLKVKEQFFKDLKTEDILKYVYNSRKCGEIEIFIRPSNKQELAFKLKTSDKPFALIKIGDISGWLKGELEGYEVNERFDDEGYFENLNKEDSVINILMGSRSFYEGWDSNRPNVINFINIGTGTDAQKFILQSVGRGVRIEPLPNKRKRLISLHNAKEVDTSIFNAIHTEVLPIETLLIFGTNRNTLRTVIGHLNHEKEITAGEQLSLFVNEEARKHKLLIPTYKESPYPLIEERSLTKFEISQTELDLTKSYIDFIHDDRVLLATYEVEPKKIKILKDSLLNDREYYKFNGRNFKDINLLLQRLLDYFSVIPEELDQLKELEEEIKHFKHIKVFLKEIADITQLRDKIRNVRSYPCEVKELEEHYGKISQKEYAQRLKNLKEDESFESGHKKIRIKNIANHYYLPLILAEDEKVDYIQHIVKTKSEVEFINKLEEYLNGNNKFNEFDWWLFSKLDESLDDIYLPYYNPDINEVSKFKPDFIFWLQKGVDYFIIFIDPKGTKHSDYTHKVDGYKRIFEEGNGRKIFHYEKLKVKVLTFLYTDDVSKLSEEGYREYWFDNIEKVLAGILKDTRLNCNLTT